MRVKRVKSSSDISRLPISFCIIVLGDRLETILQGAQYLRQVRNKVKEKKIKKEARRKKREDRETERKSTTSVHTDRKEELIDIATSVQLISAGLADINRSLTFSELMRKRDKGRTRRNKKRRKE